MGILETMQRPNHWSQPADYPVAERQLELTADARYAARVTQAYSGAFADSVRIADLSEGSYFPTDAFLLACIEDVVYHTADESKIGQLIEGHPLGARALMYSNAQFESAGKQATTWSYYGGGPGARRVVHGDGGRWFLYERNHTLFVPELDARDSPTGQFVGLPSYHLPSFYHKGPRFNANGIDPTEPGLGKYVDPDVEVLSPPYEVGIAPWAGNVVLPALVSIGKAHKYPTNDSGLVCCRKIVRAWKYEPNASPTFIPKERPSQP